jgi:hypothetical protein
MQQCVPEKTLVPLPWGARAGEGSHGASCCLHEAATSVGNAGKRFGRTWGAQQWFKVNASLSVNISFVTPDVEIGVSAHSDLRMEGFLKKNSRKPEFRY